MTWPACDFRGAILSSGRRCYCRLHSQRPVVVPMENCLVCPVIGGDGTIPAGAACSYDWPCLFRGDQVRSVPCKPCQNEGADTLPVLACSRHGECMIRGRPREENVQSCNVCPDRRERIRVGLLSPSWVVGGVTSWFNSLVRFAGPGVEYVGVAVTAQGVQPVAPCATEVRRDPDAVAALRERSDVLIAWGHPDLDLHLAGFAGPVVLVSHGCGDYTRRIVREAAGAASHLVAVSEAAAGPLRDAAPRAAVTIIPNGVEIDRCMPTLTRDQVRAGWGVGRDDLVIGYVGRLCPGKNVDRILEAAATMPSVVVICGDGPEREKLAALANSLEVDVRFVDDGGHVGNVYAGLDVLALLSDDEGFGLVIPEAIAAGVPVVSTPVGVAAEWPDLGVRIVRDYWPACDVGQQLRFAAADGVAQCQVDLVLERFNAARCARAWSDYLLGVCNA